jgi:hypothetical protein
MATTTKSTLKKTTKKPASKSKKPTTKSTTKANVTTKKVSKSVETKKTVSSNKVEPVKKPKVSDKFSILNKWNWVMAGLHALQAVAVIVLAKNTLFPVSTNYITLDSIASTDSNPVLVGATRHLFDVNLAYIVAAFFIMSALAHLYIVTVYKNKYAKGLEKGINKVRWYEYGISASTMMLGIAMLSGVADLSTLVLIFVGTLVMNLCGLIMEVHNQTTQKTNWLSYIVGTIAGLGPWIVVGIYFWGASVYGTGIPTFVYYIYASIFVFFSSFAVNMYLQYRGKGKWADYLYGEKVYMILSLVAKSALAWQIFAGTLRP